MIIVESSLSDQLSKKPERTQLLSMIPVQFIFTSNSTRTCSAGRVLVMTQSPVVGDTNPYCGVMLLPPVYENLKLIPDYNTFRNSAPFMPVLVYSTWIARSAQTDLPTGDTGPHIPRTDLYHKLPIEIKPQVITTPNGH